jgi:transposase-like protein
MTEIARELGVLVAPCTILRWVVRYSEAFSRLWQRFERPLGRSWRCDETYLKVGGVWMYLYRAVDELGRTVAVSFLISGSDSGLGFLRKFGADLTGLLRLNCGSSS